MANLKKVIDGQGESGRIVTMLRTDVLKHRRALLDQLATIEIVLQVEKFLNPQYNKSLHRKYLGD